jgi:hypothetical protein
VFGGARGITTQEVKRAVHLQLGPPWPENIPDSNDIPSLTSSSSSSSEEGESNRDNDSSGSRHSNSSINSGSVSSSSSNDTNAESSVQFMSSLDGWIRHHEEYGKHCGVIISMEEAERRKPTFHLCYMFLRKVCVCVTVFVGFFFVVLCISCYICLYVSTFMGDNRYHG